jgi:hypothetical protein
MPHGFDVTHACRTPFHLAALPIGDVVMIDIAAALTAVGMTSDDIAAIAAALQLASDAADDAQRRNEADSLWEGTYGQHDRANAAMAVGREWSEKGDRWRGILYALTHGTSDTGSAVCPK